MIGSNLFSQDTLTISNGSIILVDSITYVTFNEPTVDSIAMDLIDLDACKEIANIQDSLISTMSERIDEKDGVIQELKNQSVIHKDIIQNFEYKDVNNKNYISTLKIEAKRAKVKTAVLGTLGTIFSIGVGILIGAVLIH